MGNGWILFDGIRCPHWTSQNVREADGPLSVRLCLWSAKICATGGRLYCVGSAHNRLVQLRSSLFLPAATLSSYGHGITAKQSGVSPFLRDTGQCVFGIGLWVWCLNKICGKRFPFLRCEHIILMTVTDVFHCFFGKAPNQSTNNQQVE